MDASRAQGVIGGMFGDEGKGLMTDALASRMMQAHGHCVVARFNGGAQAGHTVQTPQGVRHVFHHIASGALVGASTYLGPRFVSHPTLFLRERQRLLDLGGCVQIAVDPRGLVSTPYDVMVNQAIEKSRGDTRHGSCGIGFGETIERGEYAAFRITVGDLLNSAKLEATLQRVRRQYLPRRLEQLGLDPELMDPWRMHDGILERFLDEAEAFASFVKLQDPARALQHNVVFEGAQGLGLDEELGWFPHVTRSKTGLPWLHDLCVEAGIDAVDIHYGTRAYTTRHGAGPLPHEDGIKPPGFEDATNQPNAFQGSLRFAALDVQSLDRLIKADLARVDHGKLDIQVGGFVSCLDQMSTTINLGGGMVIPTHDLPRYLQATLGLDWMSESRGPSRDKVSIHSAARTLAA